MPYPSTVSIKLKYSKTDQFRKGVKLVMEKTNNYLWQVTALISYLFHHSNTPSPLFQWDNTRLKIVVHVHCALLAANIPSHICRQDTVFFIRAATIAASTGIGDSTIQTFGHWKSLAYLLHIRLNHSHLANLSTTVAQYPT